MAKITNLIGELSGKMGGLVFAKNKAGAYVRAFAAPTNPRSNAQLALRSAFTSTITSWHALTDAVKAQWNNYAVTNFKAKYPIPGVRYSGFNAFVSLRNQVAQALKANTFASVGPFSSAGDLEFDNITLTPPSAELSSNIVIVGTGPAGSDTPTSITLQGGSMIKTGNMITANFRLGQSYSVANPPRFVDAIGQVPVGIAIMASLGQTQNEQFVREPKYTLVAVMKPQDSITVTTPGDSVVVSGDMINTGRKLDWTVGDVVELNAFLISERGATQPIGSAKVTIS